ncbi:MAG: glycosyltransferase [Bacteroidetes bacterium MedPE-SWsnd-G2]|nr:MAG: glycosyltransferase [Bacteroidetes bacterium MedPE-SWsnd-G2]
MKKVLIIQQKMIGDVLTSSILFEAIKQHHPNWELHYLVNSHTTAVVDQNPFIDKLVFFTPEIEQSKRQLFKFSSKLKRENYDVIIDVYSKLSSNIITLFSGAETKISYHKSYTSWVYTHNIKRAKTPIQGMGLAILNRLQLLEPLDITPEPIKPKIYLTSEEIAEAKGLIESHHIDKNKPIYMIGALGSGATKTYPLDYLAKVLDQIVEQTNATLLFNYIPKQKPEVDTLFSYCNEKTKSHIKIDLYGSSLRSFLALTSLCDALIGNEGGAVNMAKALNIKTFTIFSPWIDKATWSLFENEDNVSVHLKDFSPEIYQGKSEKDMKQRVDELYLAFKPDLFTSELQLFLQHTNS